MEKFPKLGVNRTSGRPLRLCANCGDAMIAATSLQYVSERCVRNFRSCDVCGFEVETTTTFTVRRTPIKTISHRALLRLAKRANSTYTAT
jgi:hypothetical protein